MDTFPKCYIIYSFAILQVQDNHVFKNGSDPLHEGKVLAMERSARTGVWCTRGTAEKLVLLRTEGEQQSWFVKCAADAVCKGMAAWESLETLIEALVWSCIRKPWTISLYSQAIATGLLIMVLSHEGCLTWPLLCGQHEGDSSDLLLSSPLLSWGSCFVGFVLNHLLRNIVPSSGCHKIWSGDKVK